MRSIGLVIPTLAKGGAEKVAADLTYILSSKYEVHLILFDFQISYPYTGYLHVLYKPITPEVAPNRYLAEFIKINERNDMIKKIVKEEGISVLITFDEIAFFSTLFIPDVPKIATIHKSLVMADKEKRMMGEIRRFNRAAYSRASCVVAPTQDLMLELKDILPAPCFKTIYNPVDVDKIRKLANQGEAPEGPYALNISRAVPQKNPLALLEIYKEKPLYMLAREGPLLSDIIANVTPNIKVVTDWIENIYPWYKNSSYYVSTSNYEGFSLAIAEAMSLNKPSLSTDCPHGPAELLGNVKEELEGGFVRRECGITGPLVNKKNIPFYRKYAEEMFDMKFKGCVKRARKLFSPDMVRERWIELIESVAKK